MKALSLVLLGLSLVSVLVFPQALRLRVRSLTPARGGLMLAVQICQVVALLAVCAIVVVQGDERPLLWLYAMLPSVLGILCALVDARLYEGIVLAGEEMGTRARALALEEQVVAQREHLAGAERAHAETERARQACLESFQRLAAALAAGDDERIKVEVDQAATTIPRSGDRLCKNLVADALLKSKMAEARAAGVTLVAHANLPSETGVTDAELCAVASNLIDNAIRASAALSAPTPAGEKGAEPPVVRVTLGVMQGCLVVKVRNPSGSDGARAAEGAGGRASTWIPGEGAPVPEHGWGLSIVREIAEHRGGKLFVEEEGGFFRACAVLPLEWS